MVRFLDSSVNIVSKGKPTLANVYTADAVVANLGIYPVSAEGRLIANGIYILRYDIIEYPSEYQLYDPEFDVDPSQVIDDQFSTSNRTIKTIRIPYRRGI